MDIYPEDLGPVEHGEILRRRALFPADSRERAGAEPHSAPIAEIGMALVGSLALGWLLHSLTLTALMSTFVLAWGALAAPRAALRTRQPEIPLMAHEVREAQQGAKDSLTRQFLDLVVLAISTPSPDAEAQASVREALRSLGTGIAGLSQHASPDLAEDPVALRAEADHLAADADRESDGVVASSQRRRAEALRRQAEIATRTATLLRRNDAIRQEVGVQIGALRTSLTAFRIGGVQTAHDLADVAASIQSVAIEAAALTQARDEIGVLLSTGRLPESLRPRELRLRAGE